MLLKLNSLLSRNIGNLNTFSRLQADCGRLRDGFRGDFKRTNTGVMNFQSLDVTPIRFLRIRTDNDIKVETTAKILLGRNEAIVTVSGLFDPTKYTVGTGHGGLGLDCAMLFLPSDLVSELLPGIENYDYAWDIISDPQKDACVKTELQRLVSTHTEIGLNTFESKVAYNTAAYTYLFYAMQGVTLFISLFGVVNFINTILSNQISQKKRGQHLAFGWYDTETSLSNDRL